VFVGGAVVLVGGAVVFVGGPGGEVLVHVGGIFPVVGLGVTAGGVVAVGISPVGVGVALGGEQSKAAFWVFSCKDASAPIESAN
jgi:hypothetical protein